MLNGVFCIYSGISKLSKISANGHEQIVKINLKGTLLGKSSLISNESTNFSAIALVYKLEVYLRIREWWYTFLFKNINYLY